MVALNDELQRALAELREREEPRKLTNTIPPEVHERAGAILTTRLVQDGRILGQHKPEEYEAVLEGRRPLY
jgi:hypothetical protein